MHPTPEAAMDSDAFKRALDDAPPEVKVAMLEGRHRDRVCDVTLDELLAQGTRLFEQARAETGSPPVNLNVEQLRTFYELGMLRLLGLCTPAGALVGFAVLVLGQHPLHSDRNCCTCIALFVEPGHRQLNGSTALLKRGEELAREVGANMMLWSVRVGTPLEKILPRRGAVPLDVTFAKDL